MKFCARTVLNGIHCPPELTAKPFQASVSPDNDYVTDATLFSAFCPNVSLDVMDSLTTEGANLIHDLCSPIPASMKSRYNVIFNGSVLDNIFDPAQALRNIYRVADAQRPRHSY